ncbi:uncharacterized protein DUF4276 [Aneurinibacillus soli]|uniref:Uncharacterized protein n=1 Tax=Aneurinibacillus soli TaxID=1500254 RepID=A0A0U5AQU2_9BACL|nr:DUF4276 family protein [Aneurinibacillus soli]PYE58340.1 uncharacterized protein DUF4276 [Aneurinibacillus soli]BAU26181.1 hypothetical protein CB4_00286 [Aneurinibacillus soli]
MKHLMFLLEEPSTKKFLDEWLPKWLPEDIVFTTVPHEGKHDLQKSIPRKIRAMKNIPDIKFIIIHDQDSADCIELKKQLQVLCREAGCEDVLIRIACHELESWFLGDLLAVERAFNENGLFEKHGQKSKFREPDKLNNAAQELKKIIPSYQKVNGARKIAAYISIERNRSLSFRRLYEGINRMI